MRKSHAALPGTQRGATLIIALLILVMIMMYGIPAAMNSTQNERMAGNTRNRDLAFQAAESALKIADSFMNNYDVCNIECVRGLTVLVPMVAFCVMEKAMQTMLPIGAIPLLGTSPVTPCQ